MRLGVEESNASTGETELERIKGGHQFRMEGPRESILREEIEGNPETDSKNGTGDSTENYLGENHVEDPTGSSSVPGSASIRGMLNYDVNTSKGELTVKIICLGDSAVGKSKLLERFLINSYKAHQVSTYALTLYRYNTIVDDEAVVVDFWDTAGQERFHSLHPSYYHQAHACIMVFDATRKVTYKNLSRWYDELRQYRPMIPCFCAANKIDANMDITKRQFAFATKNEIPFYFVSASDGTNVVKLFRDAICAAMKYKKKPTDWQDQVLSELEQTVISDSKTEPKQLIDETPSDNDNSQEKTTSDTK
ncbi:Rab-like protein 2A [Orchesella cincta]|uniref:Rab-like protein 2A n=1 Tax=Orchesella cincta TaxID=48709 RepID=A0A1D2NFY2_ORCCI|nr:Rab-like protein 2A [Orchesella cincta]